MVEVELAVEVLDLGCDVTGADVVGGGVQAGGEVPTLVVRVTLQLLKQPAAQSQGQLHLGQV
jgi:hypothetical protein